ncbi:hypothetical protein [Bifidobacterium polysaccharolyticum]|nr:hypothetical protein [Bifidobacterium polysaccharolyticum]
MIRSTDAFIQRIVLSYRHHICADSAVLHQILVGEDDAPTS